MSNWITIDKIGTKTLVTRNNSSITIVVEH